MILSKGVKLSVEESDWSPKYISIIVMFYETVDCGLLWRHGRRRGRKRGLMLCWSSEQERRKRKRRV